MIWFFHSGGTETSLSSADRATADSAPVDISAAARRKIPSNRGGFSILQPKLNDDAHTTAHLAAGDVCARYSLAGGKRGPILSGYKAKLRGEGGHNTGCGPFLGKAGGKPARHPIVPRPRVRGRSGYG